MRLTLNQDQPCSIHGYAVCEEPMKKTKELTPLDAVKKLAQKLGQDNLDFARSMQNSQGLSPMAVSNLMAQIQELCNGKSAHLVMAAFCGVTGITLGQWNPQPAKGAGVILDRAFSFED